MTSGESQPMGFPVKLKWNETIADVAKDPREQLWGLAFQYFHKLIQNEP